MLSKFKHSRACVFSCKRALHVTRKCCETEKAEDGEHPHRKNELGIQMLSKYFQKKIFNSEPNTVSNSTMQEIKKHLSTQGLLGKMSTIHPEVEFTLPDLQGENLDEHFQNIAKKQLDGYKELAESLINCTVPEKPKKWSQETGWTKYDPSTGKGVKVDYPECKALVFDIENLVPEGNYPTMATAVSSTHWYSWCSDLVNRDRYRFSKQPSLSDLIPLETADGQKSPSLKDMEKRLIVGHNVAYDRSFVKEQYYVQKSKLRFLDTMSLNIAVCGQTSFQRILHKATNSNSSRKEVREHEEKTRYTMTDDEWKLVSSANSLKDVFNLQVGTTELNKEIRNVFVKGTMPEVREKYQSLMSYCADDVCATLDVFKALYPQFQERFPHPVTLSGMIEMGTAYLPINQNWYHYIDRSNETYNKNERELKLSLMKLANDALELMENDKYKDNPWMWDLDWSVKELKMKVPKKLTKKQQKEHDQAVADGSIKEESTEERIAKVLATAANKTKAVPHMPGYPKWYAELCPKKTDKEFKVGPSLISTTRRVTPKLLQLSYEGYPLHYSEKYAWGYVVPSEQKAEEDFPVTVGADKGLMEEATKGPKFPTKAVYEFCGKAAPKEDVTVKTYEEYDKIMNHTMKDIDSDSLWLERKKHFTHANLKAKPHGLKKGIGANVGNPLAKDFLVKFEAGLLKAEHGSGADDVIQRTIFSSYWKMNKARLENQMAIIMNENEIDSKVKESPEYEDSGVYGAITPRVVTAGTVTRRAVEATWLTASNAKEDRIGSELKAMIQSPPGYKFVGADVDSQELWIAALIGDSTKKIHGCTAFGWMTLQGKKSDKTDLHSKTAETINISRDHAKVFNYSRIYGAGQKFVERMLQQFNPTLTEAEAKSKSTKLYRSTKGVRKWAQHIKADGSIMKTSIWRDGSESDMFNQLEAIAKSDIPRTPVLGSRISKALEPQYVGDDFMTSRVNWVVQSSAVDYLHMMLVCMNWLIEEYDIQARFSISIHDEVRYLVSEDDQERAALALQITNLLTRSMFALKLGMTDLPQSVAFFSAVDIDTCLRKEVFMDCRTPSNPHGMMSGYNVPPGQALDIYTILKKTGGTLEQQVAEENSSHNKSQNIHELENDCEKTVHA